MAITTTRIMNTIQEFENAISAAKEDISHSEITIDLYKDYITEMKKLLTYTKKVEKIIAELNPI